MQAPVVAEVVAFAAEHWPVRPWHGVWKPMPIGSTIPLVFDPAARSMMSATEHLCIGSRGGGSGHGWEAVRRDHVVRYCTGPTSIGLLAAAFGGLAACPRSHRMRRRKRRATLRCEPLSTSVPLPASTESERQAVLRTISQVPSSAWEVPSADNSADDGLQASMASGVTQDGVTKSQSQRLHRKSKKSKRSKNSNGPGDSTDSSETLLVESDTMVSSAQGTSASEPTSGGVEQAAAPPLAHAGAVASVDGIIAAPEEAPPSAVAAAVAPAGSAAAPEAANSDPPPQPVYPAHLKASEVARGLKAGKFVQGELCMAKNTCYFGSVLCADEEIVVSNSLALNRALDGDTVVLERLDAAQAENYESTAKRIRHRVGSGEPLSESEDVERVLEFSGKRRGRVVSIVKRNKRELVGSLLPADARGPRRGPENSAEDRVFVPSDKRFPYTLIKPPADSDSLEGKRVVITINVWDRFSEYPRGQWTRVLGDSGNIDVETEMILIEHNVKNEPFSEDVLACLPPENFRPSDKDLLGREDFRHICVCSIDPPGCQDIDDALSCEVLPNGNFRVGVHIADVTHFVHPDTPIDVEAASRGTSVYLVDRRIDMLPKLLTTDICSLRDDGDRLTFSAMFEMTLDAEVVSDRFCKSVIRSRKSLSYEEAQVRLDSSPDEDSSEVTQAIRNLSKLSKIIRENRMQKGALDLGSDEVQFEMDSETKTPTNIFKYKSFSTNKLIEEFMLLANQAAAVQICTHFRKLSVLRRHPPPKEEAMGELTQLLTCHGIDEFNSNTNWELAKSLDKVHKPTDPFFNKLVRIMATRCMNEALYFCTGDLKPELYEHYGLAMSRYTHFTSPIRRYADVMVHRFLAASLGLSSLPDSMKGRDSIGKAVAQINLKHRMSQWADRASVEMHLFLYFKARGPVVAEGVVMRVQPTGLQVAVEEYGAEGIIEMHPRDWTIFKEKQRAVGRPLSEFEGVNIGVFHRVNVRIEADLEDGRLRALKLKFVSLPVQPGAESVMKVLMA